MQPATSGHCITVISITDGPGFSICILHKNNPIFTIYQFLIRITIPWQFFATHFAGVEG
jgi:hypothetical protein